MTLSSETKANPYSALAEEPVRDDPHWADDGALIVPPGVSEVTLPPICWVSGSTENLESRELTLRTVRGSGHFAITLACMLGPILGFASKRFDHSALSDLGLFLWYGCMTTVHFLLTRKSKVNSFETQSVKDDWTRIRWSTYAGLAVVLLSALGIGLLFHFVAAVVTAAAGGAALMGFTRTRLHHQTLSTQMRSDCVAITGFSDAFHATRQQLELEGATSPDPTMHGG